MAATKLHAIKCTPVRTLAYITNEKKTENGLFVFSHGCSLDADEAAEDFLTVQQSMGTGRSSVLAQHLIQSFKPGEVTPEQAFEIGKELCEKFLGDAYQYVLAVHTDRQHIHCHVVFNNTNMENGKTFETLENRKKDSWKNLRTLSDTICEEHGLSVIPETEAEKSKGKSHYEWDMNRQGLSWKTQLKFALDDCIMESDSFEDFLEKIRAKNIEVDYNPEHKIDLKFRMDGQERWSRARTIGWYYETLQLKKRIAQFQMFRNGESQKQRTSVIDTTQEKFRNAKGLSNWANIQNMKNASEMINLLTNLGVSNTDELESKSINNFQKRMLLVNQLNNTQHEIDAVSDVLKNLR
ncbi:MAG: relaxase/mobilization nuclease domain-containing protein [Ruminococcus sp.]|nr:relaxase/mobilization nuclease domain-containing protein [Ruminococcus sp.]